MNRELTIKVGQRSARRLMNAQTPENCIFDEGWDNPQECQDDMTCCCTPCDMPIDYCGCDNNNCCQNSWNNGWNNQCCTGGNRPEPCSCTPECECRPEPCDCNPNCDCRPDCNDPCMPCNPCDENRDPCCDPNCDCNNPQYPCGCEPNYECNPNNGCNDEWNCRCEDDWNSDSDGSDGWVDGNEVDLCYDAPDCNDSCPPNCDDNCDCRCDCSCEEDCCRRECECRECCDDMDDDLCCDECGNDCKCFEKTTECIERRGPIGCDEGTIVTKTITRVRIVKHC